MMAVSINRRALKAESKALLADAQVSPKAMVALYLGLVLILNLFNDVAGSEGILSTFVYILTLLISLVLQAGFVLYCMAVRRRERAELTTLFDGFSFVGKVIALSLATWSLVFLWSMLFIIPGVIAAYRYRFALLNLCENPELGVLDALALSKRQTRGCKWQLFLLDLSYLGWSVLCTLPAALYQSYYLTAQLSTNANLLPLGQWVLESPQMVWTVILGLWQLAVSLFYYAQFQCTELAYFELAKAAHAARTSGGPDDLSGF